MEGRRVHPDRSGQLHLSPGDYGKTAKGLWWVYPPRGSLRVLDPAQVTEHDDGTITVNVPIANRLWNGKLAAGRWQQE